MKNLNNESMENKMMIISGKNKSASIELSTYGYKITFKDNGRVLYESLVHSRVEAEEIANNFVDSDNPPEFLVG